MVVRSPSGTRDDVRPNYPKSRTSGRFTYGYCTVFGRASDVVVRLLCTLKCKSVTRVTCAGGLISLSYVRMTCATDATSHNSDAAPWGAATWGWCFGACVRHAYELRTTSQIFVRESYAYRT